MHLLPLLVLTATLTGACNQTRPNPNASSVPQSTTQKQTAQPVIVFQRTPCFGICPDYEATIYPDGRVTLIGRQHVNRIGTHEMRLPQATVDKILAEARQAGFAQLRAHYAPENVTDLPSTILSIRQADGTLKTVQVEAEPPAGLKPLLDYVGTELDKLAQQGVER